MPTSSSRRAALLALVAGLAAYVLLHSPLRDPVAGALGFGRETCYFCLPAATGFSFPDTLAAFALLLAAAGGAWAVAAALSWPAYERVLAFGLLSITLVTVPAALLGGIASLSGASLLQPPAGPLLAALPALALLAARLRQGWRPSRPPRLPVPGTPLLRILAAAAALLVGAELAVTLLHPPSQGDALTYHAPLGVLFWGDGDITALLERSPETWGLSHPGSAELLFGLLRVLGGERLANMGQLPFALLGSVAVYAFTRRTGLLHGAAALAACAFLLVPMVALQLGTQANDLAGATLVMTAIALAAAPVAGWRPERLALIGLALGLAAATKLALVPSAAGVGLFVAAALFRGDAASGRRAGAAAALLLAALIAVTPWWARNIVREGNPLFPQSLPLYGHGVDLGAGTDLDFDFVERRVAWPVYPLVEPIDDRSGFGIMLAIAIFPGLIAALGAARRQPLALFGLSFVVTLFFWWVYSHHEPRFLLAYAGLALALVPWSLVAVPRRRRALAAGLVAGAALFSVALVADQQLVPLARQPLERAAFYDRVYGVDPVVESIPQSEGILLHTGYGFGPIDYASYYPLLGRSQERLVIQLDADVTRGSSAVVVERMRAHGLRYAYVQALPERRRAVEALFRQPEFELVHSSVIVQGDRFGVRRRLFRSAVPGEVDGVRRYLFRLADSSS